MELETINITPISSFNDNNLKSYIKDFIGSYPN